MMKRKRSCHVDPTTVFAFAEPTPAEQAARSIGPVWSKRAEAERKRRRAEKLVRRQQDQRVFDKLPSNANNANMTKKRKRESVTAQLRGLIRNCGVSVYVVSRETGIDNSTLSRFLAGERGLSHKALDRLGEFLDLEVVAHGPKR